MASKNESHPSQQRRHLALVNVPLAQPAAGVASSDTTTTAATTTSVHDDLVHIYEHYAALYPNHALVQEQREADELLRAIHATTATTNTPSESQSSSTSETTTATSVIDQSTSSSSSWTSRWFSWNNKSSKPETLAAAKQLHQQQYNRQETTTTSSNTTDHPLLEYTLPDDNDNDNEDNHHFMLCGTQRGLEVSAIPDEAHALARFHWASRQRHEHLNNPVTTPTIAATPTQSQPPSTLFITGLGRFTELVDDDDDTQSDDHAVAGTKQLCHSVTPDQPFLQEQLQSHQEQQQLSTNWSFRHARGMWITQDDILAVAWGLHDGWIVLYQKQPAQHSTTTTTTTATCSWNVIGTCAPTQQVLGQLSGQGALMEEDDGGLPTSPLLLVTDMVLIPHGDTTQDDNTRRSSWTLGIARLGGFVELVPLAPLFSSRPPINGHNNPLHLTHEGANMTAFTTAEYHTDVLSLAVVMMAENHQMQHPSFSSWNQELYPHTPPSSAILVASGTQMGTEHVSFWGVSVDHSNADHSPSPLLSAHILEAINLGYGGPECTLFATPTLYKYWRKARQVQLSSLALSHQTNASIAGPPTSDASSSSAPITTISVSKPLGRILVTNSVVLLWDGNGCVTSMDCQRLMRLAYHCLDEEEYHQLMQTEEPSIPLVTTLFERSHLTTQLRHLPQDSTLPITEHITSLQLVPPELSIGMRGNIPVPFAILTNSGQLVLCSAENVDISPLSLSLNPSSRSASLRSSLLIIHGGKLCVISQSTNDEFICHSIEPLEAAALLSTVERCTSSKEAWDITKRLSIAEQDSIIDTVEGIKMKVWESEGDIKAVESLKNEVMAIRIVMRFCLGETEPPVHLIRDLSELRRLLKLGLQRLSGARLATTAALGGPDMTFDVASSMRNTLLLLGTFQILGQWLIPDSKLSTLSVKHFLTTFAPSFDVVSLAKTLAEESDLIGLSLLVFRHWETLIPNCEWLLKIPPTVPVIQYAHLLPLIRGDCFYFVSDASVGKTDAFESFPNFIQERYQVRIVINSDDKRLILGSTSSESALKRSQKSLQNAFISRTKIIQGFTGSLDEAIKFSELVQSLNESEDAASPLSKAHQSLIRVQASNQAFVELSRELASLAAANDEGKDPDTLLSMILESGETYRGMTEGLESIISLLSESDKASLETIVLDFCKKAVSTKYPFVATKQLPAVHLCAAVTSLSKSTRPLDSRLVKDTSRVHGFVRWTIQVCIERCRLSDAVNMMDPLWFMYESLSDMLVNDQDETTALLYGILKATDLAVKWKSNQCHELAVKLLTSPTSQKVNLGSQLIASIFQSCFLQVCAENLELGNSHYAELLRGALADGNDIAGAFDVTLKTVQELATTGLFIPLLQAQKTSLLVIIANDEFDEELVTQALSGFIDEFVFSTDELPRIGMVGELRAKFSAVSPLIREKLEHAQMCIDASRSFNLFPRDPPKSPLRPIQVKTSSSLEVLDLLFCESPESVVFGCDEWADKASAAILNQSIRDSMRRVEVGNSLQEKEVSLPRLPGQEIFNLAQILGLVSHNEVVVVKCRSAMYARLNGFHGACAALCRDLLLKDLPWKNERSSVMEEMVLHEVAQLVETTSFEDLATKVELCNDALAFSWANPTGPSYERIVHAFASLECSSLAAGSHTSSLRTFQRDTLQHMSQDVYGLFNMIALKADDIGPSDESLASLSRFSVLWSIAHVTKTPGWQGRGKINEVGDIGIWSLKHIRDQELYAAILSELEKEAYEEIKRVEASVPFGSRVNEEVAWQIQQRGYSRNAALRAASHGPSFDEALQWAMMHSSDFDFDAPLLRINEASMSSKDAEWLLRALGKVKSGKIKSAQGKFLPEAQINAGLATNNRFISTGKQKESAPEQQRILEVSSAPPTETLLAVHQAPQVVKVEPKVSTSSGTPKISMELPVSRQDHPPVTAVNVQTIKAQNPLSALSVAVPQNAPDLPKASNTKPQNSVISSSGVAPLRKPRVSPQNMSSTDRSNFRQRGKDFLNKLRSDGNKGKSDRQRLLEQGRQLMQNTKASNVSNSPASLSSLSTDSHTVPSMRLGPVPPSSRAGVRSARIAPNMSKTSSLSKEERQALVERARSVRHEGGKTLNIVPSAEGGSKEPILSPSMADKGRQLLASARVARSKDSPIQRVGVSSSVPASMNITTSMAPQRKPYTPSESPPPAHTIADEDDNWDFDDEDIGLDKSIANDLQKSGKEVRTPKTIPPPPPRPVEQATSLTQHSSNNQSQDEEEDDGWDFDDFDQDEDEVAVPSPPIPMPTSNPPAPPQGSPVVFDSRVTSQSSTIPPNSEPLESPAFPERKVLLPKPKEFDSRPPAPERPAMPPIPPPPPLPPPVLDNTTDPPLMGAAVNQDVPPLSLDPTDDLLVGIDGDEDGWDFDDVNQSLGAAMEAVDQGKDNNSVPAASVTNTVPSENLEVDAEVEDDDDGNGWGFDEDVGETTMDDAENGWSFEDDDDIDIR